MTEGGDGTFGKIVSEETKEKFVKRLQEEKLLKLPELNYQKLVKQ